MSLQKEYIYNVAIGETARLIFLSRLKTENFLIIGIHALVLDATSFQTLFRWLAFHYNYPNEKRHIKQFSDVSEQRHADYIAGKFAGELQYWRKEFETPPKPLPLLICSKVD